MQLIKSPPPHIFFNYGSRSAGQLVKGQFMAYVLKQFITILNKERWDMLLEINQPNFQSFFLMSYKILNNSEA